MQNLSFLFNAHPSYIESLYNKFLQDPESIDPGWQSFFKGFDLGKQSVDSNNNHTDSISISGSHIEKELGVFALIDGYRNRGHLLSDTNPIRKRRDRSPKLDLSDYNLSQDDTHLKFFAGRSIGLENGTLNEIIQRLKYIYASKIGFEYSHIESNEKRMWIRNKIEGVKLNKSYGLTLEDKRRILEKLNGAVIFEKFLHTKYVGQKRFSLEGGESTIAALDFIIETGAQLGVQEFIIGMAHRGRLNVLANIIGKTYEQIFSEFEGTAVPDLSFGSGDVKYHLGYSSQVTTKLGNKVQLKLAPNPSHLEAVNPVVEGLSRAKADILYASDYDKILPILIHGDAAVAGQGVVYELVQMSHLEGYYTGGTIHLVINNQIGFTTDFDDARSSTYCTAAANVVQAPVFHVNGDDPEAVIHAVKLATEYRQEFNNDVFIDLVCYRRHGHNEGDDPKFTQPEMYDIISQHPNVRELYIKTLTERGDVDATLAVEMEKSFWSLLQGRLEKIKENPLPYIYQEPEKAWRALKKKVEAQDFNNIITTGINEKVISRLLKQLSITPENFNVLPKVKRLLKTWDDSVASDKIDWGQAELLAYASIINEGKNVRISGQDVKRGTFSHRHAVLFDEQSNEEYVRLSKISETQGNFFIYNSLLSEFAVLGFEYGYSMATPNQLVIWEAQFGDFANGAQVIFDQFVSTSENKWGRMSGLVMLLPHGYDGQGPEHSSARLERYLQAAAEYNILVCNISTPANFFHALRRQLAFEFRKPLIIMSPKSLLRNPLCISKIQDFTEDTGFQTLIVDQDAKAVKGITKLVFCSGQFYYDLLKEKEKINAKTISLVRIEQLYPFPKSEVDRVIKQSPEATILWVQEEPENMGAASYIRLQMMDTSLKIIARSGSAASAVGYKKVHDEQLEDLIRRVFN